MFRNWDPKFLFTETKIIQQFNVVWNHFHHLEFRAPFGVTPSLNQQGKPSDAVGAEKIHPTQPSSFLPSHKDSGIRVSRDHVKLSGDIGQFSFVFSESEYIRRPWMIFLLFLFKDQKR